MKCPGCAYQSPYDALRCPECRTVFDAEALETLGHLTYLRERLERWQSEGLLTPEAALAAAEREIGALAERLTLTPLPIPSPLLAPPPAAAPLPRTAEGPGDGSISGRPEAPSATPQADGAPIWDVPPAALLPHPNGGAGEPQTAPVRAGGPLAAPVGAGADGLAAPDAHLVGPLPAAAPGPAFEWRNVGTYLLSERTLHALLGLGALLILASGVVISTLNPTGLGPYPHLGAVVATTLLFFAAGAFVRQKLRLTIAGATLLGIAGAFVPLTIWTLGQRQLLDWETGAIWLAASLVSLPLYLAVQRVLHGRTFALLAAVAAGSEVLASLHWLGVPLEWGLAALVLLAVGYVRLGWRLRADTTGLGWALSWSAQTATPLLMAVLLFAKFGSDAWQVMAGRPLGAWHEYAIGAGWWLGTLFYVQRARLWRHRYDLYAAAWTLPVAYLLTLTRAPWDAGWYNVCLTLLAAGYLAVGYRRLRSTYRTSEDALAPQPPLPTVGEGEEGPAGSKETPWATTYGATYGGLARDPFVQVALALALLAACWPPQTALSRIVTLSLLAGCATASTTLFRVRAPAWIGLVLVGVAYGLAVQYLEVPRDARALAWTALGAALLVAGDVAVRRTGEGRRQLWQTVLAAPGWGRSWQSRLGAPLFAAGYLVSFVALALALADYWQAPAEAGVRRLSTPTILGFVAVLTTLTLSSLARRTGLFLYAVVWLALIPLMASAAALFDGLGWPLREPALARLLAGLSFVYLGIAWLTDRQDGRYARPIYLAAYLLLPAAMLLSALDRAASLQVVGFGILVYALSAWLTHTNRLPSFQRLVERLCGSATSEAALAIRALWLYLAAWLLPIWVTVLVSLWQPSISWYALALSGLALLYPAAGLWARRVRPEYRWPMYLGGYALSAIAPLVALPDTTLRPVVLALSIGLYVASAIVGRRSGWLYPVAVLGPVLLWQALGSLEAFDRWYGVGLVTLAIVYGAAGVALHALPRTPQPSRPCAGDEEASGVSMPDEGEPCRRVWLPIRGRVGAYGLPFFVVGYALGAFGLARAANQDRELATLAFALGATQYAASGWVFRQPLFGWVTAGLTVVAYVVGLTLTPLDPSHRGLGLLPGGLLALVVAEVPRRGRGEGVSPGAANRPGVAGWPLPWLVTASAAAVFAPPLSRVDQQTWTLAWWGSTLLFATATVLLRHPLWLYPTLGAGTAAYLASGYLVDPTLPAARSFATLAALAWLFLGSAWLLERWRPPEVRPSDFVQAAVLTLFDPNRSGRPLSRALVRRARGTGAHWLAPLHVAGWAALILACLGSVRDAQAGLVAAGAVAVLLTALTLASRSEVYAWVNVAAAVLTLEHGLRVAGVSMRLQPPCWAAIAVASVVLSEAGRLRALAVAAIWSRPFRWASVLLAVGAVLAAVLFQIDEPTREVTPRLALTVALAGLTAIGHAAALRDRRLAYLGVALLEAGLMLELLFFEVGQPQAFALPAGAYLLAIAYVEWRRGTPRQVKRLLELAGLTVLLSISLIQAVGFLGDGHDRYVYDTFLLLESAGLLALGAVLRWRYTFFAGAIALVVDVGILLVDPLRTLNTWYLVALIGLALIGGVIWIERQRQKIPLWLEAARARLESWD